MQKSAAFFFFLSFFKFPRFLFFFFVVYPPFGSKPSLEVDVHFFLFLRVNLRPDSVFPWIF